MKKRTKSLVLQKLEAVIPRLPSDFLRLSDLQYEMAKEIKGYIGEKKVDYFLDHLAGKFSILRGVYLRVQGKRFQIDTLVIAANAMYIVEVKSFNRTITFDTILNQFTRDDGEKETGYRHPITQAELQQIRLENWLQEHGFQNIPIHFFIAISDPATIIKVIGDAAYIARLVAQGEHIPGKILEKEAAISREGGGVNHRQLGQAIKRACKEYDYDILRKFNVKQGDILPGVHCPSCGWLSMARKQRNWYCPKCTYTSEIAHSKALAEYLLLVKSSISNTECRQFLQINSRYVATRILQQSGLVYEKESKRWVKRR